MSAPFIHHMVVGLVIATPVPLVAQRTWQADVRIQAMEVMPVGQGSLSLRVQVSSGDQEVAKESRLEILIPVGVEVVRVATGCRPAASVTPTVSGRVSCELGDLPARGLREVILTTSRPPSSAPARFAAFVMSSTPDPEPGNNFAERAVR